MRETAVEQRLEPLRKLYAILERAEIAVPDREAALLADMPKQYQRFVQALAEKEAALAKLKVCAAPRRRIAIHPRLISVSPSPSPTRKGYARRSTSTVMH